MSQAFLPECKKHKKSFPQSDPGKDFFSSYKAQRAAKKHRKSGIKIGMVIPLIPTLYGAW